MSKYISIEELYNHYINTNQKITTDTRKIEKGSIFFALKGDNFNGNEFAQKATESICNMKHQKSALHATNRMKNPCFSIVGYTA